MIVGVGRQQLAHAMSSAEGLAPESRKPLAMYNQAAGAHNMRRGMMGSRKPRDGGEQKVTAHRKSRNPRSRRSQRTLGVVGSRKLPISI